MPKQAPTLSPDIARLAEHYDALIRTESERGAAIVGAALIEEALRELVRLTFDPERSKKVRLLTQAGSFGGLIEHASAMGIISEIEYKEADRVRVVRNSAGHGLTPGVIWTFPSSDWEYCFDASPGYTNRERFSVVVALLAATIWRRVERARELAASNEAEGRGTAIVWLIKTARSPWDQTTYLALRDADPPSCRDER